MDDGWWLTTLWVEDDEGVVEARAGGAGRRPSAGGAAAAIGPVLSSALMGLLDQEDGRQLIRLRMPPAEDEGQPGEAAAHDGGRTLGPRPCQHHDPNQLSGELLRASATPST